MLVINAIEGIYNQQFFSECLRTLIDVAEGQNSILKFFKSA